MKKILEYLKESRAEFQKVIWPSRQEVVGSSVVVVISVAVISMLLLGYDVFVKWALTMIQSLAIG